jgi:rare lipoprotein A
MPQRGRMKVALAVLALAVLAGGTPSRAASPAPAGADEPVFVQRGVASQYHDGLRGRKTASGERFRQDGRTAASRELPLGARITVTHEETGRSVEVRVNDRGPHVKGRIVDLSRSAAEAIGLTDEDGVAPVRIEARPSAQPTQALKRAIARKARQQAARRPPLPQEKPAASGRQG